MERLMTPENIAILIAAIGFSARMLVSAFNSWVETRNKVKVMRQDLVRLQAEAEARNQDAENENQTKIINILERLTEQNGRWPPIIEDSTTAQNRNIEVMENYRTTIKEISDGYQTAASSVAKGLHEMAAENRALRISMESWPKAVDETLAGLSSKIETMEKAVSRSIDDHENIKKMIKEGVIDKLVGVEGVIETVREQTTPDQGNRAIVLALKDIAEHWPSDRAKIAAMHRILSAWDKPPDGTEPDDALPPAPPKQPLDLDAAKADATVESDSTKDEAA